MKLRYCMVIMLVMAGLLAMIRPEFASATLIDGLSAYWKLDGNGTDSSGHGYNLMTVNAGYSSGLIGQALHLNGNAYAVRPTNDTVFDFSSGTFTIQVWVNYNNFTSEETLIEKFSGMGGPGWTLTRPTSNDLQFYWYGNSANFNISSGISNDVWSQIIVAHTPTTVELFLDGSSLGTQNQPPSTESSNPLLIGKRDFDDPRGFYTNGRLDEVAIWNRNLSNDEISFLYNGGQGNPVPTAIPEPATMLLLGSGLLGLAGYGRRKFKKI